MDTDGLALSGACATKGEVGVGNLTEAAAGIDLTGVAGTEVCSTLVDIGTVSAAGGGGGGGGGGGTAVREAGAGDFPKARMAGSTKLCLGTEGLSVA